MKKIAFFVVILMVQNFTASGSFSANQLQEVTVKDGDTLWGIANQYLKDPKKWPELLKYNKLSLADPAAALPGMKLMIPVLLIKEELRRAYLIFFQNQVKFRKRNESEWKKAVKDTELYNDYGLRTLEESRANVRFYSGDVLKLDQNSLVILRPELKVEEVNLLTGALIAGKVKLITQTAQVTPHTKDTLYKAKLRIDKGLIVQVERGSTEVLGVDTGEKVVVPAGHANITFPDKAPGLPVKVPSLPDFQMVDFDESGRVIVPSLYASKGGEKERSALSIDPIKGYQPGQGLGAPKPGDFNASSQKFKRDVKVKKYYRIQFSLYPDFSTIARDKQSAMGTEDPMEDQNQHRLPDGLYHRRISFLDGAGNETDFIALPDLDVDNLPPKLLVFKPPQNFATRKQFVQIEGQTEPRCFVRINDFQVPIKQDAKFSWSVLLNEGPNKIKFAVTDKKGNVTTLERTVTKLKSIDLEGKGEEEDP